MKYVLCINVLFMGCACPLYRICSDILKCIQTLVDNATGSIDTQFALIVLSRVAQWVARLTRNG